MSQESIQTSTSSQDSNQEDITIAIIQEYTTFFQRISEYLADVESNNKELLKNIKAIEKNNLKARSLRGKLEFIEALSVFKNTMSKPLINQKRKAKEKSDSDDQNLLNASQSFETSTKKLCTE